MTRRQEPGPGDDMPIPDVDTALGLVREATFGDTADRFRIGVEAEFVPIVRETRQPAGIEADILPALRPHARAERWRRVSTSKGAPVFEMPDGGRLTFEPGGQLEYAAPPFDSPSEVLSNLRAVLTPLGERMAEAGIDLYGNGVDPFNGPDQAKLQVAGDRYRHMDEYYARFGPSGARMMRQTASIQVNIDPVADVRLTWRVLNALAPVLVAMFANSKRYAGRDTGYASFRSWTWQALDRTRTGLPWAAAEPDRHYAEFALDAPAMFIRSRSGACRPFRHWIEDGVATADALAAHVSTLFPEVRPRRYFEVRSVDALPLSMYAAPILLLAGLTFDESALRSAGEILGTPDTALLARAARSGLRDADLAERAMAVARLAMAACRARPDLCHRADVEEAEDFFSRFTDHGRSPADAADTVRVGETAA